MNHVFALCEVHKYEGSHMHAIFKTRLAALKSGLKLKRKRVQQALDTYRDLGIEEAEWMYRHCWDDINICVEMEIVRE